jgi:hypothetical protein
MARDVHRWDLPLQRQHSAYPVHVVTGATEVQFTQPRHAPDRLSACTHVVQAQIDGQTDQIRWNSQVAGYAHDRGAGPVEGLQAAQTGCRRDTGAFVAAKRGDHQPLKAGAVQQSLSAQ